MYSNFFIWKTWTLLADLLWAKLNLDATPSICWMVERSLLNLKIPCGKCTKSLTHMLIGSALSGKLSQPGLAIILQVFPNCRWMFVLVLRSYSESKELYVLRTLKLWLEKKKKKKAKYCIFPGLKITLKTVNLFQKAKLCLTVWGPCAISLRTHTQNEDNTETCLFT